MSFLIDIVHLASIFSMSAYDILVLNLTYPLPFIFCHIFLQRFEILSVDPKMSRVKLQFRHPQDIILFPCHIQNDFFFSVVLIRIHLFPLFLHLFFLLSHLYLYLLMLLFTRVITRNIVSIAGTRPAISAIGPCRLHRYHGSTGNYFMDYKRAKKKVDLGTIWIQIVKEGRVLLPISSGGLTKLSTRRVR